LKITIKSIIITLVGVLATLTLTGCGASGPKFNAIEIPKKMKA